MLLVAHKTGPGGRPQKYTPEQIEEIRQDLEDYIQGSSDPTIVGFTSSYTKYSINKDYIYDHTEFSVLVRKSIEKQEHYLLYGATNNRLNASVSIFRLKQPQHGFRDRFETDITSKDEKLELNNGLSKQQMAKQFDDFLKNQDKT